MKSFFEKLHPFLDDILMLIGFLVVLFTTYTLNAYIASYLLGAILLALGFLISQKGGDNN
ncbi:MULTISPECIES: hypothetical protein [Bacillus]|uniref:hypothetical protein n=1 Tax=Bacillus TaxID=1386 RepID=UPI0021502A31|nr:MULTISPECIES: hypothetical protein [Bacillus]MCR4367991.1 hypothetical protein [Bacillus amyloliquefaciens]MCV3202429.1 hypothetical protein [Bacillus velezensis]MCX2823335.1 hypothetical protein [Bacillus sp. H1F1]